MAYSSTRQYRPIGTGEVSEADPVSVRMVKDTINNMNNAQDYALAHKVIHRSWPIDTLCATQNATTDEQLVAMFCPVHIPERFQSVHVSVSGKCTSATSTHTVTFKVYSVDRLYMGSDSTFDSTVFQDSNFASFTAIAQSDGYSITTPTALTLAKPQGGGTSHYFLITAELSNTAATGVLNTFDVTPRS